MPVDRLRKYLEENHVEYVTVSHSPAFTAQEIAAKAHVPGRDMAKTVMVKLDGRLAMVVLPAPDKVSAARLKDVSGATVVELASEREFAEFVERCLDDADFAATLGRNARQCVASQQGAGAQTAETLAPLLPVRSKSPGIADHLAAGAQRVA